MKYCIYCGAKLEDDAKFCLSCGKPCFEGQKPSASSLEEQKKLEDEKRAKEEAERLEQERIKKEKEERLEAERKAKEEEKQRRLEEKKIHEEERRIAKEKRLEEERLLKEKRLEEKKLQEEARRAELERIQKEKEEKQKASEVEQQKRAEKEKSEIRKQIEQERAELEKLRREKEALLQDKQPKAKKEEKPVSGKNLAFLPIILIVLGVFAYVASFGLNVDSEMQFDPFFISLIMNGLNIVMSIIFMCIKKFNRATKFLFLITLLLSLSLIAGSIVGMLGSFPGRKSTFIN